MLCHTQAERKVSENGCTDALGKLGDAEPSLTKHARKSENQPPPFPQYHRLDYKGRVALFINEGSGWMIHTEEGVFYNPWTHFPFTQLSHAKSAIKARWKFGRWPGKKHQPISKTV